MPINPLSAVGTRLDPRVQGAGAHPRMALIADIINKAPLANGGLMRLEPLLSLLSDTETLSLFIRHAGLSKEQGAALARDVAASTGRSGASLAQPGGELHDLLSRIRPTTGGVNSSYRDNLPSGEWGSGPGANEFRSAQGVKANFTSAAQFTAFSPTPQDYARTVDDVSVRGQGRDDHAPGLPPGWYTPVSPTAERIRGISNLACLVLACAIGVPVLVFFLMFS